MRAICCLAVVLASLHSADAAVVPSNAPARYWPAGVVRWAVDEASGASARDPLILEGTADWEFHTCLVFERCTLATCSPPFLKFKRSDASEATCTSDATGINPAASKITTITIGPHCGTGTMLSAIGHALGLENEQRRRDRAQHVKVIPAAIAAGKEGEFSQDAAFVDIGAYDYDSIVHDGSHSYSASGLTTIDAPHGQTNDIGQRNHINPLVSAAVNFVYNGCKAGKKGPSCMASYNTTLAPVTVTPGVSHLFTMALRSNDVFSIEIDSNLPAADAVVSAVTGDSFNAMGVVTVDFTPGSNTAGSAYTFKLTVKAGDGSSSTCSHAVRVASAFSCFGIDSSAAEVCSAHGKCTAHDKCSCSAAYEGLDCAGSISCSDVYTSFDTPPGGPWTDLTAATFGTDVYARGGTSLFLGSPTDDQSTGSAKLSVKTDSSPFKITFHAAVPSGAAKMDMRFKQADGTTCLTFIHNELGWGLDYFEADVPALPRQFDFIELRPSWLSSTTDLFINGHHVMHDQPFEESCLTGMSSVTVDANAWIDEFRILCSSGITMTGRVTEGDLGQEDFRSGGISITLEIVGDEWINTDANKEALVESLLADVYAGNGWSHQKRLMLTADLVSFSGAKATLGPLKGSAGYTAEAHEHVRFHLKPEMFTTGRVPEHDIEEVSFKIFGWCAVDVYLGFDRASEVIDNGNFGFSSEFFSGTGSMKVNKQGVAYIVPVEDLHPNHFVWYGKIAGNTELQATLTMGTSSVTTIMGKEGTFAILIDGDGQKMSAFAPGRWHKFRLLFDWDARTIDIKPDDILYDTIAMPDGMGPISRLMFQELQGTGGLIDSVHLSCDYRDPTVMMTPFCPRAGFESSSFVLNQGSDVLFEEDRLAVVPWRDDQNCADAATECQALNACSDSHGFFELKDSVITWKAGVLNLAPGGEYTICMFAYSYQMWFPLDEFVTCALGFTAAPATDAPGPTPPTNAPTDPPSGTPVEPPPGGTSAAPQEETPPPGSSSAPADTPPATPAETPPNTTAGPAETVPGDDLRAAEDDDDGDGLMVLWIVLAVVAAICLLICIVVVLLRWRATKAAAKNKSGFKAFDPGEEMKKSDQGSKGSPKSKMIDFDEDFGEQTLKQISVAPVPDDSPGLLTRQPNSPRKKGKVDDAALPEGTSKTNYVELNDLLHGSQTSKRPYSPAASLGSMRSSRKGSPAGSPVRRPSAVAGADSPLLESSLPPLRASAPSPTRQSRRPSAPGPATPVSNFDAPITLLDI